MEYRAVWLTFFAVLFLLGVTVGILPGRVISVLRQTPTAPDRRYVLGFSVLGGVLAVVSIVEFISIIEWGHLL